MSEAGKKLKILIKDAVSKKSQVNWNQILEEWQSHVSKLYKQVKDWIKQSEEEDKVAIKEETIHISEDYVGSYPIKQLSLTIGDNIVRFIPKGMLIIGARGRVDIVCGNKTVVLLLLRENESPSVKVQIFNSNSELKNKKSEHQTKTQPGKIIWKISKKISAIETIPFTENEFIEALEQLIS